MGRKDTRKKKKKKLTLDNIKRMEDPIACITSTAEQTASLTLSISPYKRVNKPPWLKKLISNHQVSSCIPLLVQLLEGGQCMLVGLV